EAGRMVRRAEDLCRQEQQLEQKESAAQAARVTKQAAWRRMGGLGEAPAHALEPHVVDRAERVVQRQIAVRAQVTEMRRRLAALGDAAADGLPAVALEGERLDALRRCRSDLARWLEEAPAGGRVPGWAWGVAFVLAALGVGLALASPGLGPASLLAAPWLRLAAPAALLVWLAVCVLWLQRLVPPSARVATENLNQSSAAAGLALPNPFTSSEAARWLQAVVAEVARVDGDIAAAQERAREVGELRGALDDALADARRIQSELHELRSQHGFEVGATSGLDAGDQATGEEPDGGFAYWLSAALEHAQADDRLAEAEAQVRVLEDRVGDARSQVVGFLSRCAWGHAVTADTTGTDLLSACTDLAEAVVERDRARERADGLGRTLQRVQADLDAASRSLDTLARKLFGSPDDAKEPAQEAHDELATAWTGPRLDELALAARDLVDALPAWRSARAERDRKSTRLNSSHVKISYAVFCLKKKRATKPT